MVIGPSHGFTAPPCGFRSPTLSFASSSRRATARPRMQHLDDNTGLGERPNPLPEAAFHTPTRALSVGYQDRLPIRDLAMEGERPPGPAPNDRPTGSLQSKCCNLTMRGKASDLRNYSVEAPDP